MGTKLRTWTIPSSRGADVTDCLIDHFERRGLALADGDSLFDAPGDDERWLVVAADERFTVVVDTDWEEHERIGWELARLASPLLELWVYDDDIWGYRLFEGRDEIESFDSNPRYFGGDAPDSPCDATALCKAIGSVGREAELRALFRQKNVFALRSLQRFAAAIGVPGGACAWEDWLYEEPETRGYTVARLRFARARGGPVAVDLHSARYPRFLPAPRGVADNPPVPDDVAARFAALQVLGMVFSAVFWLLRLVLAPVGWLIRGVILARRHLRTSTPAAPRNRDVIVEGRTIQAPRHRLRLALPEGATLAPSPALFGLDVAGLGVDCIPRRRAEAEAILTLPPGATVLDDARYFAGERAARGLVYRLEVGKGRDARSVHHVLEVLDGPEALYVFRASSASPIGPDARATLRAAVGAVTFGD